MSRLDWKHGRFSDKYEIGQIDGALFGHQRNFGDYIDYYRFLRDASKSHDVYDEGDQVGRVFAQPMNLPVLHVTHQEGPRLDESTGFYYNDELHVTASLSQLSRVGLTFMDLETQDYLKDRFVYDDKVFRVTSIDVLGQIVRRDIIVAIDATHVKPDELVDDLQFAKWAAK